MNLIRKGHGHKHRGVVGIESAIVLIAFVIVAAALAFVVLNMGFATSQKAKTAIVATLGEAGSSLQVSGKVFAWANSTGPIPELHVIGIPIKIASGGQSVNLLSNFTAVKYVSDSVSYDDIYEGVTPDPVPTPTISLSNGVDQCLLIPLTILDDNPITDNPSTNTGACIYFTVNLNNNNILDQGEHAILAVIFGPAADRPTALDKIKIELIPPSGATLTVERQIPNISTSFVDLG